MDKLAAAHYAGARMQPTVGIERAARTRILFVDDEPLILSVLEASLEPLADQWEADFAGGGEEALARMARQPYDIIVSDMRMPGVSGVQLLNEVMRKYPRTARIVLSGYADMETVLGCVGAVHQYMHKPLNLAALHCILTKIRDLHQRLGSRELQTLASRLTCPPSLPALYIEMLQVLQSPSASLQDISALVCRDPALAAKTLQLVNSAFFGFSHSVSTIGEAVQLLGVGVIRSLALVVPLFSAFDARKCPALPLQSMWDHSLQAGWLAWEIALAQTRDELQAEHAFAAGLMHDIGKLILADGMGEQYALILNESTSRSQPLHRIERETLNATHAEVGGYLLGLWNLPAPLVEAVALHHNPGQSAEEGFTPLTAVHIANALAHEQAGRRAASEDGLIDLEYLHRLGLSDRVPLWRSEFIAA